MTYVGVVQATLVDRLGFSNSEANLPASAYLWSMPLAVVVIWLFPRVRCAQAHADRGPGLGRRDGRTSWPSP